MTSYVDLDRLQHVTYKRMRKGVYEIEYDHQKMSTTKLTTIVLVVGLFTIMMIVGPTMTGVVYGSKSSSSSSPSKVSGGHKPSKPSGPGKQVPGHSPSPGHKPLNPPGHKYPLRPEPGVGRHPPYFPHPPPFEHFKERGDNHDEHNEHEGVEIHTETIIKEGGQTELVVILPYSYTSPISGIIYPPYSQIPYGEYVAPQVP